MRLAIINKDLDKSFRDEANVKVDDIERALEDKIKKLTETVHYNELQINRQEISLIGPRLKCNNSWQYNNLVCLDFIVASSVCSACADRSGFCTCQYGQYGLSQCWQHPLNLNETLVFNTYSPQLCMYKLDIWMVFHKNGLVSLTPNTINCTTRTDRLESFAGELAVNCLIVL